MFLTIQPTVGPFAEDSSLCHVVNRWRELAGIQFRSRQRHGLHSLRHTLATQLLPEQTPIHVISGILGHDRRHAAGFHGCLVHGDNAALQDMRGLRRAHRLQQIDDPPRPVRQTARLTRMPLSARRRCWRCRGK